MQAVVLRDGRDIVLEERPEPQPGPGEVLLRSQHCGICGTDLHAPGLTDLFLPNIVMGHEFAGEVVAIGPEVSGWQHGNRASINPNGNVCGTCEQCNAGQYNLCHTAVRMRAVGVHRDGGMAQYVSLPTSVLNRLPDGVSTLQGAWVEPLATVLRAVRMAGFKLGGTALVLGAGPIGLLTVQALRRAGASEITVVEPSTFRRSMAERLGADRTIDPRAEDPVKLFGSELARPEYVFECAGHPGGVATGVAVVRPHGSVTVVGISPEPLDLRVDEMIFKEVVVRGSIIYVEEFPLAIRLLEQGAFDVESLTSQVLPLESFNEGFQRLRQAEDAIKILLQP